jgi:hypothetical protein
MKYNVLVAWNVRSNRVLHNFHNFWPKMININHLKIYWHIPMIGKSKWKIHHNCLIYNLPCFLCYNAVPNIEFFSAKKQNKNVDIKVGAQDAFLEQPSSGTLRVKRLKRQLIYAKGHKHDCQYRLWSSMSDGGEPY